MHNAECERIKWNLLSLQSQTEHLTKGDIRKVKKLKENAKFNASNEPKELIKPSLQKVKTEDKNFQLLKRKCFDKKNDGLLGFIETSEKLDAKRKKFLRDINGILDRTQIDRPFAIKEKIKCIWNRNTLLRLLHGDLWYNSKLFLTF